MFALLNPTLSHPVRNGRRARVEPNPLSLLSQEMERLFGDFNSGMAIGNTPYHEAVFSLRKSEDAVTVTAELPGVAADDVEVTTENGQVTIVAKRKLSVPDGFEAHRTERRGFQLSRTFAVPRDYSTENITAHLKDGLFTLTVPRGEKPEPKKITVSAK